MKKYIPIFLFACMIYAASCLTAEVIDSASLDVSFPVTIEDVEEATVKFISKEDDANADVGSVSLILGDDWIVSLPENSLYLYYKFRSKKDIDVLVTASSLKSLAGVADIDWNLEVGEGENKVNIESKKTDPTPVYTHNGYVEEGKWPWEADQIAESSDSLPINIQVSLPEGARGGYLGSISVTIKNGG